ncbi:hypothetical protein BIW11_08022 [Tropilaelaps mercedesae]|uniref:Uncharacterized protein n=1 Tax=Tropilaelaps mercedesae TaxID=418985 RepID=A0A1V9XRD0_9ACAR|nr:hypothetical protein BIW11_08022 [Tropilaelaps mercedesae]
MLLGAGLGASLLVSVAEWYSRWIPDSYYNALPRFLRWCNPPMMAGRKYASYGRRGIDYPVNDRSEHQHRSVILRRASDFL